MIRNNQGFTLIELVTVMAVMGVVLFFTLPRFSAFNPFEASMTPTGKLLLLIGQLKSQALESQQDYLLRIDTDTGRVWVSSPGTVSDPEVMGKKEPFTYPLISFSDDSSIEDVNNLTNTQTDEGDGHGTIIRFSGGGYCDQAYIYIREKDREFTVIVEPFLPRAQLLDGHISCGE